MNHRATLRYNLTNLVSCYPFIALQDYCELETFQPRCPSGDVILMKSALYGRMRIGRCITKEEVDTLGPELGAIGCSADVLDFMDRKCSRKADCTIRMIDISTEIPRPCFPTYLNLYLEANYECIKGKRSIHSMF